MKKFVVRIFVLVKVYLITNALFASQQFATVEEETQWIQNKIEEISTLGYTHETDILARQVTQHFVSPTVEKILSVGDVDHYLKLELYYAFNTQWGTGKTKDHRLIYDFLSKLDKTSEQTPIQKEYLSTITILSLASQEYFWNEKSTIHDLKNKIKRELRYGLYKKSGHKLNVTNLIYLDETEISRISNNWITEEFLRKLQNLSENFRTKVLGPTFAAIFDDLSEKLKTGGTTSLPMELPLSVRQMLNLEESINLKPFSSAGDGMCGENSLFIPTDGACGGISEGNARYKIERAILDQANDEEAHRLYLLISPHINNSEQFLAIIQNHLISSSEPNAIEIQYAIDAYKQKETELNLGRQEGASQQLRELITRLIDPLSTILNQFKIEIAKEEKLNAWTGNGNNAFKDSSSRSFHDLIEEFLNLDKLSISPALNTLIDPIRNEINRITNQPGISRQQRMAERNRIVGTTLRSYIDADILPCKASEKSLNLDKLCEPGNEQYVFLTNLCISACTLVADTCPITNTTEAIIENEISAIRETKDNVIKQIEYSLSMERLKILEMLSALPSEFSMNVLKDEMHKKALSPGELSGWLPCDAIYTQLWAIINNLNIFVFSSGETYGRSGLDLIIRLKDQDYRQEASHYPKDIRGHHLATVILTSQTAKNLYLNKSTCHYDKFLNANDLCALAREMRHLEWIKDPSKYALYP